MPGPDPAEASTARTPGSQGRKIGVLIRMNVDFGGEKFATATWGDGSTADLQAGQFVTFSAGAFFHPHAPYAVEATLGYKFDKVNASNGNVAFTRIPLDVIASYANGRHRLGAGPTVHFSPTYHCHVKEQCDDDFEFDTAIGGIAQYAYGLPLGHNSGLDLAVRATAIRYTGTGLSMDGTSVGALIGVWF